MKNNYNKIMDLEPVRESFIIYAAWYKCISAFSAKSQALAFKAICEYALFNIPIPKVGFSRLEYGSLMSFVPILDGNKRRYENGKKGASHGFKGGRPKKEVTPVGLSLSTPNVNVKVKDNDNDNDNDNDADANDALKSPISVTYDYIYTLLLPIFFFKNCNAKYEIQRFYRHYNLNGWRLTGGDNLDSPQSIAVAAERWKPEDNKPFFPHNFINVWRYVYKIAPDYLKKDVLEVVSTIRQQCGITLVCSSILYEWLHSDGVYPAVEQLF